MALQAGRLSERVAIEQLVDSIDAVGGQSSRWVHLRRVWAEVEAMSGDLGIEGDAVQPFMGWRVVLRFADDLVGAPLRLRLRWAGMVLDIRNIEDPESTREQLLARCELGRE